MPSFDVVSEVSLQELRNAVDQVTREVATRFDFRGSKASVELKEKELQIVVLADDQGRLDSINDLLRQKLSKRGVSVKGCEFKPAEPAGDGMLRELIIVKQGLTTEELKKLSKMIKEKGKRVTSQIQGQQLRVTGKQRDDLQLAMALLRAEAKDLDLQFNNFRD